MVNYNFSILIILYLFVLSSADKIDDVKSELLRIIEKRFEKQNERLDVLENRNFNNLKTLIDELKNENIKIKIRIDKLEKKNENDLIYDLNEWSENSDSGIFFSKNVRSFTYMLRRLTNKYIRILLYRPTKQQFEGF